VKQTVKQLADGILLLTSILFTNPAGSMSVLRRQSTAGLLLPFSIPSAQDKPGPCNHSGSQDDRGDPTLEASAAKVTASYPPQDPLHAGNLPPSQAATLAKIAEAREDACLGDADGR
jgi:hypothetical protein